MDKKNNGKVIYLGLRFIEYFQCLSESLEWLATNLQNSNVLKSEFFIFLVMRNFIILDKKAYFHIHILIYLIMTLLRKTMTRSKKLHLLLKQEASALKFYCQSKPFNMVKILTLSQMLYCLMRIEIFSFILLYSDR